jgi:hypothetical protein
MFTERLLDCLTGKNFKKKFSFKTDLFNLDLACADPGRKVAHATDVSFFGHA